MFRIYFLLAFLSLVFQGFSQSNQKLVLIEQFTSTTCPSCGSRNPEFAENILETYPNEVIHVAYHNGIPLDFDPFYQANPTEVDNRDLYYNINASPQLVMNGVKQNANNPMLPISWLEPQLNLTSSLGIDVIQIENSNGRTANVSITAFEDLPSDDYSLQVMVVEKHIIFCTYFEYLFDNVFRLFIENSATTAFTPPSNGNTDSYSIEFELEEDWQEERIFVIAFVQNNTTQEIINVNQSEYFSRATYERACVEDTLHLFATVQPILCACVNSGYIDLDMCIDTAPLEDPLENDYAYNWSNGSTTQDIYDLAPGTYTVDITQNRTNTNHIYTFEVEGSLILPIVTNIESIDETNSSSDGSIEIVAEGGTGELSILWVNGATTFELNNLSEGTYTATITDENGCTAPVNVEINNLIDELEIILNSVNAISCNGFNNGSINISVIGGTEPYDIDWSNSADTEDIEDLMPGSYTVVITDAAGLTASQNYVIIEPPLIIVNETITPEFDGNMDGSISLEISGGTPNYNINWSNGENTSTISNLTAGNYSVEITDNNNCVFIESYTVAMAEEGGVIVDVTPVTCNGDNDGQVNFTPFGDISIESYIWFGNGTSGINLNGLAPGEYDFAAVDENNDVVYSGVFEISEPAEIQLTLNTSNGFETGFVEVENVTGGTPAYDYLWNNGSDDPIISNLNVGTYSVTVSDVNGCSQTASAVIFENVIEVNNALCFDQNDGSINFIINDGQNYTFNWSNGETGNSIFDLTPGPYNVGVIDEDNEVFPFIFEIEQPSEIVINSVVENDTGSGGGIITNVNGGIPPYDWLWNNGSTETSIIGSGGESYTLTLSDANNCTVTEIFTIETAVSIADEDFDNFIVYPNPANSHITIENIRKNSFVKLFDVAGKKFFSKTIDSSNFKLSVIDYPEGIYFFEIVSDDIVKTVKIVIAH